MTQTQDCNITFWKVSRKFRVNFAKIGLGLERKRTVFLSTTLFSYLLSPSPSYFLSLSQSHYLTLSLSLSLSLSLFLTPSLSLSLSDSVTLAASLSLFLSLSLALFLFPSLNELVIRNLHGAGSTKVSRMYFSREGGHFANKELRTTPIYIYMYCRCMYICMYIHKYV